MHNHVPCLKLDKYNFHLIVSLLFKIFLQYINIYILFAYSYTYTNRICFLILYVYVANFLQLSWGKILKDD